MKLPFSILLVGIAVSLSIPGATAQTVDNSCTYSFSWGSGYNYFSFCLTKYGTLAKLESPKGKNHLDTTNPIEGFAWCDFDDWMQQMGTCTTIPGLGLGDPTPPFVSQPHPGKLPITFSGFAGRDVSLTITAIPAEKTIVMTFKLPKIIYDDKYQFAYGPLTRIANLSVDGSSSSNFASSSDAGFGFNANGHGVLLTASFSGNVGGKFINQGSGGVNFGVAAPYCTQLYQQAFFGQGTIFNTVDYELPNPGTAVFHYKVF